MNVKGLFNIERYKVTGSGLKWIAIICMLIDHIGAILVEPICMGMVSSTLFTPKQWIAIYYVLRGIGRIAFPIFAFLIAEGLIHTRSRWKYFRDLCISAVVSEVPFDLAVARTAFTLEYQNVFWTLAIGLAAIWLMEFVETKAMERNLTKEQGDLCSILLAVCMAMLAEFANTDYGAIGVLSICIYYKYRMRKVSAATIVWIMLTIYNWFEVFCLPTVLGIRCYNGARGKQHKYFFYMFYPLHLLVLVGLSKILFS